MRPADLLPRVQPALARFIGWLGGAEPAAGESLDALAKRYGELKSRLGRQAVADRLGLAESDLTAFDTALREAVRRIERLPPEAPGFEARNAVIAALRLLSWLESIQQRNPDFQVNLDLPAADDEVGRKQVRALELILRSLVSERYEDQPQLIAHLKELLSDKVVQQWLTAADRGDVLSGTTFSELASLFVSTQEFPNYEPLYQQTPFLTLLKEKRVTIRHFLDDIRRVRNLLAHNKRVTPLQVQLLDLYYQELVEPLQEAFDQGRSKVNPDLYLDVSDAELASYFSNLSDDVKAVRDDLAELRAELTDRLDRLQQDTGEIRATGQRVEQRTKSANRKLWAVIGGVTAAVVVGGVGLWIGLGTKDTTEQIKQTTEQTQQTVEQTQQTTEQTQQTAEQIQQTTEQTQQTTEQTQQTAEQIQQTTEQTQQTTEQTQQTAEQTQQGVEQLQQTAEQTKESIDQMAEGLRQLANTGGLVADPKTPAELYHNARILAQRGETDRAIEVYSKLFTFPIPYADPVIDLVTLLKAKYGNNGAAAAVGQVLPADADPRILAFARLLAGGESPIEASARLAADADPYPPALWATAEGLMSMPYDQFSFGLRKRALTFMNQVQALLGDGSMTHFYLDQIRVESIRQQLGGYLRQFPSGVMEAYDQPLAVDWEKFKWVDGETKLRLLFMWNTAAAAMNRTDPAELWVRFPGARAPFSDWANLFDPDTAVAMQVSTYPPDMDLPPSMKKLALDLAAQQNPMAGSFFLPEPTGPFAMAEIKFVEVGGIARHLCLAIPNTQSDGDGLVEYRPLADCGAS